MKATPYGFHSIDRLARSLQDLQNIISQLIAKGVTVKFVKENLTFTKDNHDPFTKLLFDVLGSFAEFERNILRGRQREGMGKPRQPFKKVAKVKQNKKDQTLHYEK